MDNGNFKSSKASYSMNTFLRKVTAQTYLNNMYLGSKLLEGKWQKEKKEKDQKKLKQGNDYSYIFSYLYLVRSQVNIENQTQPDTVNRGGKKDKIVED